MTPHFIDDDWKLLSTCHGILLHEGGTTGANLAYLGLQATCAPSERVFSEASRLVKKRRNLLDPELAGKMLFVAKSWDWHKKHLLDMLLEAAEQEEEEELQGSEPPTTEFTVKRNRRQTLNF
ncbi:hypothetical protein IV203_008387 [Nitzschia inconspicua]|uniref:HAT C-terminal dimerisation domain-containing protein n=1 Tax=Nitzschia inconspicua TaxID=303405 RepID=A0A9K3KYE5_9STRA|nr:hypothetical protein IV203_008387 [Nitzschia inconspicua]